MLGFRFRKSITLFPGVKINLSKKGISSVSIGKRGATVNIKADGTKRATIGIPGTGISYQTRLDTPISPKMTQCPYCGHRMRKQWDACPKCHQALTVQSAQDAPHTETNPIARQPVKGDTLEEQIANLTPEQREYYIQRGKQVAKDTVQGFLVLLVIAILVLAYLFS